ncbi:MAG: DUF5615 family PIN-like protein [Ignavibacteria bacterium]|nr:DUF5615 family PIN-like protein [Ignavibacteria bacterium]
MNFVADEGIDKQIVEQMRNNGHHVLYIAEISPSIPDEDVLDFAIKNEAVLFTADKDFGELIYRQGRFSFGVVLIRLAGIASARKGEIVNDAVRNYGSEFLNGFTVISHGLIRIRKKSE